MKPATVAPPVTAPPAANRPAEVRPLTAKPSVVPAPTRAPAPGAVSAAVLEKKVRAACGTLASEVDVKAGPDKTVRVQVAVKGVAAEKQVSEKLQQVPELESEGVRLEIHVMP
jgi:hypothetical protein